MTDDKKHDDKDRKKLSDEELEDVAGGEGDNLRGSVTVNIVNPKKKGDGGPLEQKVTLDPERFTKT
jgi:hypothetical protein